VTEKPELLLVGCGDIPSRMLANLNPHHWHVIGIRRRQMPLRGVEMHFGDAAEPELIRRLVKRRPHQILLTLTPDTYDAEGYRRAYLEPARRVAEAAKQQSPETHLIFVSSTSVYGQNQGEWVDESSDTDPASATARVLLEAEAELMEAGNPCTLVRFSGIYGPGRSRLIDRVRRGSFTRPDACGWTNRIHADDAGGALAHLLTTFDGTGHGPLIASDSHPSTHLEVESWIAHHLGLASPPAEPVNKDGLRGKRCRNGRLLNLGYRLRYPGYAEGYAALLGVSKGR
jgi:nucleoside-diphosphate-sugar epimerase